jgi:response regulator RpfG family c-di-GMP phosphodiesterase
MNEKMLFVDDEPAVLDGYKRLLHKDFQPDTASSGREALDLLSRQGPYAVVVSDMRMPGMDGVQLLCRVREASPDTVRVILTGYADIQSAMNAVNEGHIFRFLTKPCEQKTLKQALTSCLLQYQLVIAEKDLLENTLMGSVKVLTDVLSLSNPAAFGRSVRIRRYVEHIVAKLQVESPWRFEVAALLSQLGCITLDTDLIEAAYCGKKLSPEEQTRFDMHPSVARNLLSNIPRLEGIAWIVGQQRFGAASTETDMPESIKLGAAILRVAIAFDDLKLQGQSERDALAELRRGNRFDPTVVAALESLKPVSGEKEPKMVRISDLAAGMILADELKTNTGVLLVAKGQEVTYPLLVRLKNFHHRKAISDEVLVLVPPIP